MNIKISLVLIFALINFYSPIDNPTTTYPFSVKVSGQGKQALFFIPGFASSGEVWEDTLTPFEENFTCYTFTMAGFAGEAPQNPITFDHWKSEIANYIKKENINRPILIGHSMGGGLALALAADYPELIEKIVVVDGLPALMALTNPDFKSNDQLDCSEMVQQFQEMSEENFYEMQKASMPMLMQNTEMHDIVLGWSLASDRETFAKMYCDFSNTDLRSDVSRIQCPTLVILESYFVNFKPAIEAQYKNLKTAQLVYANKGLHFIMYDDKDWYLDQLQNFITTE
ncbi:alpha/beta hydrolase [Gelidibacter sp.]|uniref:alpha/beta fold hydrolase n=1 Tax=Gelidibacter sp. TaxID=2018083 RepID=UPI002CD2E0DD|nr:alpha/beta hydrolase [Gelidibacter sp.]HUH26959.1 alpha/beta hydrolase [Gelidibacter sp.]